jgi:hypothetical protein
MYQGASFHSLCYDKISTCNHVIYNVLFSSCQSSVSLGLRSKAGPSSQHLSQETIVPSHTAKVGRRPDVLGKYEVDTTYINS